MIISNMYVSKYYKNKYGPISDERQGDSFNVVWNFRNRDVYVCVPVGIDQDESIPDNEIIKLAVKKIKDIENTRDKPF